ncbi:hypothetical protein SOVF_158130 [Spinacia oleracea]|uniref:Photosynthetic NDH subunit of subcomplex B 5, chloroplastic n=2 Tax=Spinacia oleracea TaxID=3562 RepID=A0A9R0JS52_SPIOL|nr:photosynthetic NDH subunit of subcomplex B 5, chloroplastic [Spinacia oleracea]KNA08943.1 hypothetical protein SOVF_158130 [Spinacia oleracea]
MAATCACTCVPAATAVISTNPSSKITTNLTLPPYCNNYNNNKKPSIRSNPTRLLFTKLKAAGLTDIEPDLNEDPRDRWATNGVAPEDFVYGKYDEHHTFYESSEKGSFWGAVAEEYNSMDPPTGFQGLISWLFLPAVAAGMYFNVPGDYLFIGAGLFVIIFCIIEMDKPDQPHNFEPQIYNMERGARDKLIADYNTMDIWDFNEKYGDLWDFTLKNDDLLKR